MHKKPWFASGTFTYFFFEDFFLELLKLLKKSYWISRSFFSQISWDFGRYVLLLQGFHLASFAAKEDLRFSEKLSFWIKCLSFGWYHVVMTSLSLHKHGVFLEFLKEKSRHPWVFERKILEFYQKRLEFSILSPWVFEKSQMKTLYYQLFWWGK